MTWLKATNQYFRGRFILTAFVDFLGRRLFCGIKTMAKPATLQIKLVSTADTGFFYVTKKNPRTLTEKMELRKYDPRVRKHVIFRESKMK